MNNIEIKYKTVLSTLKKKGDVPCYRAVVVNNGVINETQLYKDAGESVGLRPETVKYVAELLFAEIAKQAALGKNIIVDNFFGTSLSIRGTFENANDDFNPAKHELRLNFTPKGELKTVLDTATAVNITEGTRCRITSVMDSVTRQDGVIVGEDDVTVYAAGGTFLIDPNAEDEGVWMENDAGQIVAIATVNSSTATTLDCTFEYVPPGAYKFVVATRGGLGKEYGVSVARRNVVCRAE